MFVLPDFLRPSSPMKEVGVWVVALFHGGESFSFRFLIGFFAVDGVAVPGAESSGKPFFVVGSGVPGLLVAAAATASVAEEESPFSV